MGNFINKQIQGCLNKHKPSILEIIILYFVFAKVFFICIFKNQSLSGLDTLREPDSEKKIIFPKKCVGHPMPPPHAG